MNRLEEIFNKKHITTSDINEHLPVLKKYSEECDIIVELGVRTIVSTWAFLLGNPKKLISVDIKHPSEYKSNDLSIVEEISKEMGIEFDFILSDSRTVNIPECDLLFIDTLHTYDQIKKELEVHSKKVKKYIILHDTQTFRTIGEVNNEVGIWPAVEEFLSNNPEWFIFEELKNNNGLTIIKKN
jgi:hypothetical protein